jgi:hypothetical protein
MMTSFTRYWLTRGRPQCLARWLSSSVVSRQVVEIPLHHPRFSRDLSE